MTDTIISRFQEISDKLEKENMSSREIIFSEDLKSRLDELQDYVKKSYSTLYKIKNTVGAHVFATDPTCMASHELVANTLDIKIKNIESVIESYKNYGYLINFNIGEISFTNIKEIINSI
jgi:phage regulator Rha-like protein